MMEAFLNVDRSIFLWIQQYMRTEWLNPVFVFITSLGDNAIVWVIASVALLIPKRTRKVGLMCLLGIMLSPLINNFIIKILVARARPFTALTGVVPLISLPMDFSFPSGHTASSFACAWVMVRELSKKVWIPAIVLAVMIAFSRMYVGVHYPSDVMFGMLSGILISYLARFIVNGVYKFTKSQKSN